MGRSGQGGSLGSFVESGIVFGICYIRRDFLRLRHIRIRHVIQGRVSSGSAKPTASVTMTSSASGPAASEVSGSVMAGSAASATVSSGSMVCCLRVLIAVRMVAKGTLLGRISRAWASMPR